MSTTSRPRRGIAARLGDALLWVASIAGVICIIAVVAAVGFHVTLIMFKTGSMEPTIPTGSLAVVHEIPAADVRVGDVVTIDRPGQLPITHRVTSVSGSGDTRDITMRGDANPVDDIAPYTVDTVRIVWTWLPGWASVVSWFSNPIVLGGLTVAATSLVTWAFWPRDEREGAEPRRGPRREVPRDGHGFRVIKGMTIGLALAVAAAIALPAPPAQAAEVETVVRSQYLELTSIGDPDLMSSMTFGVPVTWQIGVDAFPPDPGTVHLGLRASGPMLAPGTTSVEVRACPVRWVAGACAGTASTWVPTTDLATALTPVTAFGAHEVGSMPADQQRWLLVTMTLIDPAMGAGSVRLYLQAWGVAGRLAIGPNGLAVTGSDASESLAPALLGFVAVGGGILLASTARRRGRRDA
jgi:signal peptidase